MVNNLVSIIVPVYNSEQWLERCVKSILGQTYHNIQIILIDDGSQDGSAALCDEYAADYEQVNVIHQQNLGAGSARNAGLQYADGEYICFVDSDDWIESVFVEKLVNGIADADVSICGYSISDDSETGSDSKGEVSCDRLDVLKRMFMPGYPPEEACYGYLWNKLFKKSIIEKFDIRFNNSYIMWEDMLFCCRYMEHIDKGIYYHDRLYHYNINNETSLSHKVTAEVMDSWNLAAEEIENIISDMGINKEIQYDAVLEDLYMKTLIAYAKEKKICDIRKETVQYLNRQKHLLRKKYRIYLAIYRVSPVLFQNISNLLSV